MKHTTRTFLLVFSSLLLLVTVAMNVDAQKKPQPKPNIRELIIVPSDRVRNPTDFLSVIPPNTITGKIKWRKELGLPYNKDNDGRPVHRYPCGTDVFYFRSRVLVTSERPGRTPLGSRQDVGAVTGDPNLSDAGTANTGSLPKQEGDYYFCRYAILNLPLNRTIQLELEINPGFLPSDYLGFDRSVRLTAPWVGGAQPQPPEGYQRTIKGNRSVTLTDGAPRARVDFEMVYEPMQSSP